MEMNHLLSPQTTTCITTAHVRKRPQHGAPTSKQALEWKNKRKRINGTTMTTRGRTIGHQRFGRKMHTMAWMVVLLLVQLLLPYVHVGLTLAKAQTRQSCDKTRRIFTQSYGEISDGPAGSNYTQDSHCEWLIRAQNDSQFITLKFRSMGTECSYDYIFIYDGDSFRSPLLGSFSGNTEPQHVTASSGSMLILLYSDTNYVLDGFRAEFSVTNCPNNCTGNGRCVEHVCACDRGWIGTDCSLDACPNRCGVGERRGICAGDHCDCSNNYAGQSCGLHRSNPAPKEWHWLSHSKNGLPPRAAHTAVYYEPADALYVFGGYNLNEVFDSLYVFRFERNHWEDEWGIRVDQNYTEPTSGEERLLRRAQFLEEESERLSREPNFLSNVIYTLSDNRTGIGYGEGLANGSRPAGRYGHAAASVANGFVIFGGKLASGELANDLWLYNVSHNGGTWDERATESSIRPPALTRHTLTLAGEFLYVFGGAMEDGEFSSKLYRIRLIPAAPEADEWEEVIPRGGKSLDVRMVAHTTSYQRATNSLIVYGGLVANIARFSRLSERMFAFQLDHKHWAELQYPRTALHDGYAPRERAFHTTNIVGNYLLVFGGYSHKHNKEEICYDNQMYLYHLGCHSWINPEVLGPGPGSRFRYPKKQGVFAHAAAVRKGNTLLVVGGYHGNVNGDLLAYTLPLMLVVHDDVTFAPEAACPRHTSFNECLADLECGWCSADSVCYGRTIGANCTTNLQTTRCKGICSVLGDCHSCLVHGTSTLDEGGETIRKGGQHLLHVQSIAHKLGLDRCTWCVQNARCHHKDDNYGVCGEDTPSQKPGWWGSKGTEVTKPSECTAQDKRPGLTFLKYLHPMNVSMPDAVMIVNATMADFTSPPTNTPTEQQLGGQVVARLLGFIRFPPMTDQSMALLQACVSHADAVLRTVQVATHRKGDPPSTQNTPFTTLAMETLVSTNITANESVCGMVKWTDRANILVDFQAQRNSRGGGGYYGGSSGHHHHHHGHHPDLSKMSLQHFYGGGLQAFTFEFLEPYSNGTACGSYGNCLECLSDSSCGWCELTNSCLSRKANETESCRRGLNWRYLTIQPAHCSNCSNFVSCEQCIGHSANQCEWWTEDATCARRGRSEAAVRTLDQCPVPCYLRADCSSCLNDRGRCVWCEATSQCFSFSVYTSEYQFGMCREWLDQTLPIGGPAVVEQDGTSAPLVQQCKSCASHQNCSFCLRSLSCGWCYDTDNPINGLCMQGDFNQSSQGSCESGHLLATLAGTSNATEGEDPVRTSWAYAQCPDVDECELRLHDCHEQAECSNTHGSYTCRCRKGFVGDGIRYCRQTCYETCVHGHCSGAPDFRCICDLGWTGVDCSVNCACNNHSDCPQGVGRCDRCLNWTEGEFCERCSAGSFGNATTEAGCQRCDCNGHGNVALGICDAKTGECYCQDYTEGLHCEMCNRNFYGDPKDGGQCYHQCASRGVLTQVGTQGLGSFQSYRSSWSGQETRECLWIVSPQGRAGGAAGGTATSLSTELRNAIIQIEIEPERMNVTCGENAVYVYDGLPDLTGVAQQKQLIAVFCSEDRGSWTAEARSGHLTVHFKKGPSPEQGFNAIYSVLSCAASSCHRPYLCSKDGRCVCPKGFTGPRCMMRICPSDCNEESKRGTCDNGYGRCICAPGYGGDDCSLTVKSSSVVFTELFNSYLVSESFEHLRKTLPRFGHSLVADRRGSLWMFGGYSLSHGPLNDIRQFDTKNNTWMQVTVDSSPEDRMPQGRFYHAADIVGSRQAIYVYGGLSRNGTLDDLWQFALQTQRWSLVMAQNGTERPPALAGHTLTAVGREELLLLIGGYSIGHGLQSSVWLYNLATGSWSRVSTHGSSPRGIYGHTAVYHAQSGAVYVYGGVRIGDSSGNLAVSKRLYAFSVAARRWTELPTFVHQGPMFDYVPPARYLHSAVATEHYMLVFGGRVAGNGTGSLAREEVMVAYVYRCNQWIRLAKDAEKVGTSYGHTYAQAMAQDPDGASIYVVAGWDGSNHCRVTRIDLPADMCELWSGSKYFCRQYSGCSYCSVKGIPGEPASHCFAADGSYHACEGYNGTISFNSGSSCDGEWIGRRHCASFGTCSSCLATYPWHGEQESPCKWCPECIPKHSCVERSAECGVYNGCAANQTAILTADECSGLAERNCQADDCEACRALPGCSWEKEQGSSKYKCQEMSEEAKAKNGTKADEDKCPLPCNAFKNCSTCVKQHSSRTSECLWSTQLNECISQTFQPLYCSGGICGLVVGPNDPQHCPEPCTSFTQCSSCLRHAYCGWCSRNGTDGEGVCTEGSVDGPANHPAGATCAAIYQTRSKTPANTTEPFGWNYFKCPAENECTNGHHNCNEKSQRCVDHLHGYECICAPGYNTSSLGGGGGGGGGGAGMCMPVCSQGCVRGTCTEPDVCRCDFGYVGANCSIQCQCNGHSNCSGADQLDRCNQCHNNTMGPQCEKCLPFYVGDPRNSGTCVPCLQYCNGQTDLCITRDQEATMRNMSRQELKRLVTEGPLADAICLGCGYYTDGDQCETCVPGYFRKSPTLVNACSPCECNGHGDMCDPMTGEKCNCGNNTESDNTCSSKGKNHAFNCWSLQCTKCRDSYSGHPNNGHQCYKHITVESRMCFDAKTIDECKIKPQPLKPGQTVFFVIQPRYMNVDIRFIVDVTQGELDFYMSPTDESFIVQTNASTGHHDILLDSRYGIFKQSRLTTTSLWPFMSSQPPAPLEEMYPLNIKWSEEPLAGEKSSPVCGGPLNEGFYVTDRTARDLITYVTLRQCKSILRVFGLKNRLVVTLPHTVHALGQTKFYIALRARPGSTASYGLVFFRQDQLHIHLFVFFSVFFSCFFLFLAICVLAWKAKQAADMRRARRRHVVEMLHMAKRPFGRVNLSLESGTEGGTTPAPHRRRGRASKHSTGSSAGSNAGGAHGGHHHHHHHHHHHQQQQQDVGPIALEPTADNYAAVGTVFVRLPGKQKSQITLALASALIVMGRSSGGSYPSHSRGGGGGHHRRRSSPGGGSVCQASPSRHQPMHYYNQQQQQQQQQQAQQQQPNLRTEPAEVVGPLAERQPFIEVHHEQVPLQPLAPNRERQ